MDPSKSSTVSQVEQLVLRHLDDSEFSIDRLCKELGVSRSHLHRKIKENTGLSTSLFIRKIRLIKGKELLENHALNISEIAYQVGINNPQNFSRYFVRQFGVSPTTFRKLATEKGSLDPILAHTDEVYKVKKATVGGFLFWSCIIIAIIATSWLYFQQSAPNQRHSSGDAFTKASQFSSSVAVLPFELLSSIQNNYYSTGLVEDILGYLSVHPELKVISSNTSSLFQNSDLSNQEIGAQLNVDYVLDGKISLEEGLFNVTAELYSTHQEEMVWSKEYEQEEKELLNLQFHLTNDLTRVLQQYLNLSSIQEEQKLPTQSVNAYNQVLIGRHLLKSREEADLLQSLERFDRAISLDSTYSDAYAYKAAAIALLGDLKYIDHVKCDHDAEILTLKALQLDASNAFAFSLMGNIYSRQYKWPQAKLSYETALNLEPSNALINYWYSLLLRQMNRIDESLYYNFRAKILDPLYPVIHAGFIATNIYGDKIGTAKQYLEEGKEIFDDSFLFTYLEGALFEYEGEYSEAIKKYDEALNLSPNFKTLETSKIYCQGKLGLNEPVRVFLSKLADDSGLELHRKAVAYAGLGEYEQTVAHFVAAAEKGFVATDFLVDPTYRPFLEDIRIQKILKEFNFL